MILMKLRLDFPFTDLSQHFGIYIWWSLHPSFSFIGMGHNFCVVKSKVTNIQPQPKYKTRNFSKFNKEKISQRHSLKPKTNWNFKVVLSFIISTITQLNFLFVFFQFNKNLSKVTWCKQRFESFWWMCC